MSARKHISTFKIIIFGFMAIILIGTLLLMLPFSTREWGGAGFMDALFTATSATCVTGLVVRDTATYWSDFGQFVILLLIQIGGMGVVTVAMAITKLAGQRIGLSQRNLIRDAISAPVVGGVVRMTRFIYRTVFLVEFIGAAALAFTFVPRYGLLRGLWYSVFHSVSAFCNAGFDLMGIEKPFSSLTTMVTDPVFNITLMALIIAGGLGFFTWSDVLTHKLRFRRYKLQSKVAITASAVLILLPALYFFVFEYGALPIGERVFGSLFQSITARTAGFNTLDLTLFSEAGIIIMVGLMLIGGSPGSTAGGMKTTTAAVLFGSAVSVFRRRADTQMFGRRVSDSTVKNAATVFLMYILLTPLSAAVISRLEGVPLTTALFETASAIATVGVTLGITPTLGTLSRLILISLMFFGRVGGLTLIYAAVSDKNTSASKYPQEGITVG